MQPKHYGKLDSFDISRRMPDMIGGFDYAEELEGPGGVHIHFFAPPGTTQAEIEKAVIIAWAERDVMSWSWSIDEQATRLQSAPESAPTEDEPAVIVVCRKVKEERTAQRYYWTYEGKRRSLMIDAYSASMILAIWDALKPEQKQKLKEKGWGDGPELIDFCMKLYSKVAA